MNSEDKRCYWLEHIEAQKESGLAQVDYCARHQLKRGAFVWLLENTAFFKSEFNSTVDSIYVPLDLVTQLLPSIFSGVERASRCPDVPLYGCGGSGH